MEESNEVKEQNWEEKKSARGKFKNRQPVFV